MKTRSEMVFEMMSKRGAMVIGNPEMVSRNSPEQTIHIHWGDIRIRLSKTKILIDNKLSLHVYYHGMIPPTQAKFEELLSWIGLNI